jgi:thioredoxin-related protein
MAQNKTEIATKVESVAMTNFTLTFNEGLEKADKENKIMIVDFYTDWCHWCKVMDEKTFHNDSVAKKLSERFVTVRINAEDPNATATFKGRTFNNIELTRAFQVSGFPALAFISPEHEVITVMPGYIPAEQFNYILDYIDQKCWEKKMTLEEFIKKKGECDTTKVE